MTSRWSRFGCSALAAAVLAAVSTTVNAAIVPVVNGSFEGPVVDTTFLPVSLAATGWETAGPSADIDTDGPGPEPARNSGTGIFPNPAPGPTRFTNADGNQLAYIFTTTGEEFYQTLASSFALNAAAQSVYQLTVGVGNATGAPAATDQLQLRLFYTSAAPGASDPAVPANRIFVATRAVKNDATDGLSGTLLKDFSAVTSPVVSGNAAIGRPINVLVTSVGAGGTQFDFDNVRVTTVPEPATMGLASMVLGGILMRRRRSSV